MNQIFCNYAIARFRPYRESGEFVNVGVLLLCPEVNFFGYRFESRKHRRITDFFPELDVEIFKTGLSGLSKELNRIKGTEGDAEQLVIKGEAKTRIAIFKELVRTRESIFHFSEPGTALAADPKEKLEALFDFYVKRQFAQDRDYQEIIMRRGLTDFLRDANLARFYKVDQRVGNETYHVSLPFVYYYNQKPRKAIKPLLLAKAAPTEIYRHGDAWFATVRRLKNIDCLPPNLLFAVENPPANSKLHVAAKEICTELEKNGAFTIPFSDKAAILDFATVLA